MSYYKRTVYSTDVEVDGETLTVDLEHEPCSWLDMHKTVVGNRIIVAYNVSDNDGGWRVDDLMGDCMGRIIDAYNGRDAEKRELYEAMGCDRYGEKDLDTVWEKHWKVAIDRLVIDMKAKYPLDDIVDLYAGTSYEEDDFQDQEAYIERCIRADCNDNDWGNTMCYDDLQKVLEEMWNEEAYWPGDPDAVLLDVYDHSGQSWSISGGGMQCRWDTSRGAGVWLPDKCLSDQLDSDVVNGLDRRTQCLKYARQFLDTYNDIISGNVYGCVCEVFETESCEQVREESCWGFIGSECAEQALLDEFFKPEVEKAEKHWAEVQERSQV